MAQFNTSLTATSSGTAAAFGFRASFLKLVNDGPNSAFIIASTSGATVTAYEFKAAESIQWPMDRAIKGLAGLSAIASTSGSAQAVIRILAVAN